MTTFILYLHDTAKGSPKESYVSWNNQFSLIASATNYLFDCSHDITFLGPLRDYHLELDYNRTDWYVDWDNNLK